MANLDELRDPVVVAVTGAPSDAGAVRLAAAEAVLRECEVHLIAGYPPASADLRLTERWSPIGTAREAMIDALVTLRAFHPDLVVDCRVLAGDPAQLLIERSAGAAVVVVPALSESRGRGIRATMAEQVAASARAPVLVAHEGTNPGGQVVVALDGSPGPDRLIEYGFAEAAMRGVPLCPVLVWSALPGAALSAVDPFDFDATGAHSEADRILAEEVAGWSAEYPDVPVCRREICAPDVAAALVGASVAAGLLVVGARSQPARSPLALGSTPRRLIREARCPLAVVSLAEAPRPAVAAARRARS